MPAFGSGSVMLPAGGTVCPWGFTLATQDGHENRLPDEVRVDVPDHRPAARRPGERAWNCSDF